VTLKFAGSSPVSHPIYKAHVCRSTVLMPVRVVADYQCSLRQSDYNGLGIADDVLDAEEAEWFMGHELAP